jgi:hypothetical protein
MLPCSRSSQGKDRDSLRSAPVSQAFALPLYAVQECFRHGKLTPVQEADDRCADCRRLIPRFAGAENHPLLTHRAVQRPNLLESANALRDQRAQRDNQRRAERGHQHAEHIGGYLGDQQMGKATNKQRGDYSFGVR